MAGIAVTFRSIGAFGALPPPRATRRSRMPRVLSGRPIYGRRGFSSASSGCGASRTGFLDRIDTLQFVRFSLLHAPFLQS
ncbi:hypothetical protein ACN8ZM_23905 [Burkholderia aenigmatica]|uniref:hypothetical protein n=1 Tax=Burkholderia aenigmatica TaxID=2015348 RepID=UPI003B432869